MKIRDIVRTAVIKANPYWPFSTLNKTPYYFAIRIFVEACRRFPGIRAVYLRSGLAEGHWSPGLSDIDLTIIVDSRLSIDEEFAFLYSFWKRYDRLKNFFPMLGEVEILNDQQLKTWTRFGLRGYEAPHWKLLYGTETARSQYRGDGRRLTKDRLDDALSFYQGYFREKFTVQKQCPYLRSVELKRISEKIFRCLNSMNQTGSGNRKVQDTDCDNVDLLHGILACFENDISRFSACDNQIPNDDGASALQSSVPVPHARNLIDPTELCRLDGAIESVLRNYIGIVFVVLKAGLDHFKLGNCVTALEHTFPGQMPVILTQSLFTYMQRHYDPFEYGHLVKFREVLFGDDPTARIQTPSHDSIVGYLLGQVPNILAFPCSRAVILSKSRTTFPLKRESERLVERALLLKLYLEKGLVHPWYNELLTECQKHYPEEFVKLRALDGNQAILGQEWFRLLKGWANDLHNCLGNSPTAEDF
jgi:predicted nucleotidyltransferase